MTLRRFGFAALTLLALVPAALSAQSDERRRAVGDWLVEDVYDDGGGRILRVSRESGDYRLEHHLSFGPGQTAYGSQGFLVWRFNCGQGGEESLGGGLAAVEPAAVRTRLAGYLERCETPDAEAAELLRGFERALRLAAEWGAETEVAAAEAPILDNDMAMAADAIENAADALEDAADMSMDMNVDMATDMDMSVDMNSTADAPK
jgi:hypothetical protein